jgi:hypothetical protein
VAHLAEDTVDLLKAEGACNLLQGRQDFPEFLVACQQLREGSNQFLIQLHVVLPVEHARAEDAGQPNKVLWVRVCDISSSSGVSGAPSGRQEHASLLPFPCFTILRQKSATNMNRCSWNECKQELLVRADLMARSNNLLEHQLASGVGKTSATRSRRLLERDTKAGSSGACRAKVSEPH